jgi:phenylacetate-CoA ligase
MNADGRNAIELLQLTMLRRLLGRLRRDNAFYAPRLARAGVDETVASLAAFARNMPLTAKAELVADQAAHSPYGTNLTEPLSRYTRFHQTSGTTAAPLRWLDTPESWSAMLDVWGRVFEASRVGADDRVLLAFSFGPFIGFWLAFEAAARTGAMCLPGGGLSTAARLQLTLDHRVTVLCCTPTYAIRMGQAARELGMDLRGGAVRAIIVAGEPGGSVPATRSLIESLWPGATVADHHGMTEVGPVSYACPARPGVLHVVEPAFFAEVIDPDTLDPVPDGETGELVLTTLHRAASPLLRYRTGDIVRREPPSACACGSHETTLVGGILARADDMITVRGVNVYPSAVDQIVRACDHVAEYQVQLGGGDGAPVTELTLQVEPTPDCPDPAALASQLAESCRNALSLRIPVTLAPAGTLPRFEMKAQRWHRQT